MPTMVLTQNADVQGRPQRAGHVFEATDKEAVLWKGLGKARVAEDADRPRGRRSPSYNRRDMRAEG